MTTVSEWMELHTFKCEKLGNARITHQQCITRQTMALSNGSYSQGPWTRTPANVYCQSGQCELGKLIRADNPEIVPLSTAQSRRLSTRADRIREAAEHAAESRVGQGRDE